MRGQALFLCLCLMGQGAWAEGPATSPRPLPRPMVATQAAATAAPAATTQAVTAEAAPAPRPRHRPDALAAAAPAPALLAETPAIPGSTLRPKPRPQGLTLAAAPLPDMVPEAAPLEDPQPKGKKKKEKLSKNGSVCGDPAIKGEVLAPIKSSVKGCGIDAPVRVTAISGIRLNQPATISCETAAAFKTWIEKAMRPAMGKREVVEIRIAASYICRPRNNKKGAKVSEHGRGKALDVGGFVFSDGTQWSVAGNYNKQIRRAHKAACGIFGTTLGPGSDGYHEDHLHFDIASYRGGPYCR